MTWFKVDDGFHASHKVLAIPRATRLPAVGLWTVAGTWSAAQELDGFVPEYMIGEFGGTQKHVDALVKAGMWTPDVDGFRFVKWAEYQPTRAELEAQRAKDAERKRKWRDQQRPLDVPSGQVADGQVDTKRSPNTPSRPVPSRPDPTPKTDSNTDQSCPEGDGGAGDKTDIKVAPLIADLKHHADIEATEAEALAWATYVSAHAKTAVRDRTSYALTALYNGPSEVTAWFRQHRKGKAA